MANLYVEAVPPMDLNRNIEWFMYPDVWTTYILILFFVWLVVLSVSGCSPGMAWTSVNLCHALVTYHFFHWKKGTSFADDQCIYNRLTWWEQIDSGKQLTRNRKFLNVVRVVLYLIASHTTELVLFPLARQAMVHHLISACKKIPNLAQIYLVGFYEKREFALYVSSISNELKVPVKYLKEDKAHGSSGGLYNF